MADGAKDITKSVKQVSFVFTNSLGSKIFINKIYFLRFLEMRLDDSCAGHM